MMRKYVQKSRSVKILKWLTPIAGVVLFASAVVPGQKSQDPKPTVGTAVKIDVSLPLSSIPPKPFSDEQKGEDDRGRPGPVNDTKHDPDPAVQRWFGDGVFSSESLNPAPVFSFAGMSGTVQPPDTVGDVGPSHYVQMVNSRFQVFNKTTGASVLGPVNINTLWSGFGGPCQNENSGDPVVLHDQLANRWLITQFTAAGQTYFNCVALSTTREVC